MTIISALAFAAIIVYCTLHMENLEKSLNSAKLEREIAREAVERLSAELKAKNELVVSLRGGITRRDLEIEDLEGKIGWHTPGEK